MPRHPESDKIWDGLRNANCKACELHNYAQTVCLLGDGPVPCRGMIIGEAPGFREDEMEIPFSGKAGKFLRKALLDIGLEPSKLYITNSVACRPPDNRKPSWLEIKTCSNLYLYPQIDIVKPRVILILGNVALSAQAGEKKSGITSIEGTPFKWDNITCVPCRHPSAVIRLEDSEGFPFIEQKFKQNLLAFKRCLYPPEENFEFKIVDDLPDLPEGPVCTDIETNGLNPFREGAKIWSMAIAQYPDEVYFHRYDETKIEQYRRFFKKHPIIVQRATFEGTWIRTHIGVVPRIHFDVKVGSFLINENEPSGLKYQAVKTLGVAPWDEDIDFKDPNFEIMAPYNARDTAYELRLYKERDVPYFNRHPKQVKLLKRIIFPAEEIFTDVICRGFHINEEEANKKLTLVREYKAEYIKKIRRVAGYDINPASPKQMRQFLYEEMKIPCQVFTKKNAKSTSEAALIRMDNDKYPFLNDILEWRKWQKYDSTYLTPWLIKGPILHAQYGFTDTRTGRLNSTMVRDSRREKKLGATLHQCPRDPFIRNLICARDENFVIVAADLSQIELRLVAHASKEPTMIDIFNNHRDIHTETAQSLIRVGEIINKETRKKAKAVNFGFVYGMWWKKFIKYAKEKFGLNLSNEDGKRYREQFFDKYSGLLTWHSRVESMVTRLGYIDSVFGRRRHLPEAMPGGTDDEWVRKEAVRQAINSPIQSAGSDLDLFIAALIMSPKLKWDFKIDPDKAFLIGAAHDSLLFECRRDYVSELRLGIIHTVVDLPTEEHFGFQFSVPIEMEVQAYANCWEGDAL